MLPFTPVPQRGLRQPPSREIQENPGNLDGGSSTKLPHCGPGTFVRLWIETASRTCGYLSLLQVIRLGTVAFRFTELAIVWPTVGLADAVLSDASQARTTVHSIKIWYPELPVRRSRAILRGRPCCATFPLPTSKPQPMPLRYVATASAIAKYVTMAVTGSCTHFPAKDCVIEDECPPSKYRGHN